jgi:hypothetical protein
MDWMSAVGDILQRYSGPGGGTAAAPENPHEDFQQVQQAAPQQAVAGGLAQAFRSDRTPPFPEMVANLFRQSDPNQRAGLLNRLLNTVGPGMLAGLSGGSVTPEQANQVSPEEVRQVAARAEKQNPSVVDEVSSFYAQHPDVVKALGGLALTIALQHILSRR